MRGSRTRAREDARSTLARGSSRHPMYDGNGSSALTPRRGLFDGTNWSFSDLVANEELTGRLPRMIEIRMALAPIFLHSCLVEKKSLPPSLTRARHSTTTMAPVASLSHQLGAPLLSRGGARPARVARVAIRTRASTGDEAPMEVPEDAFKDEYGHNVTPERKAAVALGNLFTMAATRVILDQFTGTRHRSPVYNKMVRALRRCPTPSRRLVRPSSGVPCRLARSI